MHVSMAAPWYNLMQNETQLAILYDKTAPPLILSPKPYKNLRKLPEMFILAQINVASDHSTA